MYPLGKLKPAVSMDSTGTSCSLTRPLYSQPGPWSKSNLHRTKPSHWLATALLALFPFAGPTNPVCKGHSFQHNLVLLRTLWTSQECWNTHWRNTAVDRLCLQDQFLNCPLTQLIAGHSISYFASFSGSSLLSHSVFHALSPSLPVSLIITQLIQT